MGKWGGAEEVTWVGGLGMGKLNWKGGSRKFFGIFFKPMASAHDDSSFIIRPRHQSVFGVSMDWTLDLLYNNQRLY